MKRILLVILGVLQMSNNFAQGLNHEWHLGYWPLNYNKGRAQFTLNKDTFYIEFRKMPYQGTQATICDSAGNFLMSSNGIFIADATNDTMLGGGGLNPSTFTSQWPDGLIFPNANLFLPWPGDNTKYILLHHSNDFKNISYYTKDLFYSVIDITQNSNKGEVISKNNLFLSDSLNYGFASCKHANGVDWWICIQKDSTDKMFIFLLTNNGLSLNSVQKLNIPIQYSNPTQMLFNKAGNKFGYHVFTLGSNIKNYALLLDFDRCTGTFSNPHQTLLDKGYLWGDAFSASGNYFYTCSKNYIFQINTTTYNVDTVAVYDGFQSAGLDCDFFHLYLAANGKIYITSGSSVQHIGVINSPDSAGLLCDVKQHSIDFVNFLHLRSVPNHPNYYLGCDTTLGCGCATSYNQYTLDESKFIIYPNPTNGNFSIGYKAIATSSTLKVYDTNGKQIYMQYLPPWSNEQSISLKNVNAGMYNVVIINGEQSVSKKIIILKE